MIDPIRQHRIATGLLFLAVLLRTLYTRSFSYVRSLAALAEQDVPGDAPMPGERSHGIDTAGKGLSYCRGRLKRSVDFFASLTALGLLSPLLLILAFLVRVTSCGPVLFTQERVGMGGRLFRVLKFRTMRQGADKGPGMTAIGDSRITPVGRFLRATKLDEMPQLINVLRGEMSLVGPRPLIPGYAEHYSAEQRMTLEVRPGLTCPATIIFRDEETLIAVVAEEQREAFYRKEILQKKLALNLEYIERAGFWYDLMILVRTARVVVAPRRTVLTLFDAAVQ